MIKIPYIIGDIHGCYEELLALEEKIKQHAKDNLAKPIFVSVGDLVDRGPASFEVVDHFLKGYKKATHFTILGNHEAEFLRIVEAYHPQLFSKRPDLWPSFLNKARDDFSDPLRRRSVESYEGYCELLKMNWCDQGGAETLKSYKCNPGKPATWAFPQKHLEFLAQCPLYWQDRNLIVTHALATKNDLGILRTASCGFLASGEECKVKHLTPELSAVRGVDLKNAAQSVLWNRRRPPESADDLRIHVSGHTPMYHAKVSRPLRYVQIDTACVYGGRLTAYSHKDKVFLWVPSQTKWKEADNEVAE